jgi:hypothetical protein
MRQTILANSDTVPKTSWTTEHYLNFEKAKNRDAIAEIIYHRLYGRYIKVFEYKSKNFSSNYKNGFSMMANACLLIETLVSFKEGLNDTNRKSKSCFTSFFMNEPAFGISKEEDSVCFYKAVRCGILHTGETKSQWKIVRYGPLLKNRTINAQRFISEVKKSLNNYINLLKNESWDAILWKNLRKKMSCIIKNC